eukprot:1646644-Prymnesium_polylepis.2
MAQPRTHTALTGHRVHGVRSCLRWTCDRRTQHTTADTLPTHWQPQAGDVRRKSDVHMGKNQWTERASASCDGLHASLTVPTPRSVHGLLDCTCTNHMPTSTT